MADAVGSRLYLLVVMACWFGANGCTILLNKYIFKILEFKFPISLTLLHMFTQSTLAFLTIQVFGLIERMHIPFNVYTTKITMISVFFCANILLGNMSLRYVPVSFMQTLKSLTPVFAATLQYLIYGSRLTRTALVALLPATFGVALSAATELSFHFGGFLAAMLSCLFTALKFVLSFALLGGKYKLDAVNLLLYMAPPSVCMLLPFSLWFEGAEVVRWMSSLERSHRDFAILAISAVVSFLLNVFLFMVLKATSSVTVTIAGNLKTLIVIIISIWMFKNPVLPLNYLGMVGALVGITWYGLLRNKWQSTGSVEINEDKSTEARGEDKKQEGELVSLDDIKGGALDGLRVVEASVARRS